MFFINKNKVSVPNKLICYGKLWREYCEENNISDDKLYDEYKRKRRDYPYRIEEVIRSFEIISERKCCICGVYIKEYKTSMQIEHIQPQSKYPMLIHDWNNLLCVCMECNRKKGAKDPDMDKYLNPAIISNIDDFFQFSFDGNIYPSKKRNPDDQKKSAYMIDLYGLNRPELRLERKNHIKCVLRELNSNSLEEIKRDNSSSFETLTDYIYERRREVYE